MSPHPVIRQTGSLLFKIPDSVTQTLQGLKLDTQTGKLGEVGNLLMPPPYLLENISR